MPARADLRCYGGLHAKPPASVQDPDLRIMSGESATGRVPVPRGKPVHDGALRDSLRPAPMPYKVLYGKAARRRRGMSTPAGLLNRLLPQRSKPARGAQPMTPQAVVAALSPDAAAGVLGDALRVAGAKEIDAIAIELVGLAAPVAARDGADAPGALAARLAGIIDRARFGTASPANADTPIGAVVDVWARLSLETRRAACSLGRARLVRVASRRPIDAITRPDDENDAGRARGVGRLAQDLDAFELLPWLAGCITRAAREPGAIADQAAARLLARFGVQDLGLRVGRPRAHAGDLDASAAPDVGADRAGPAACVRRFARAFDRRRAAGAASGGAARGGGGVAGRAARCGIALDARGTTHRPDNPAQRDPLPARRGVALA